MKQANRVAMALGYFMLGFAIVTGVQIQLESRRNWRR